MRFLSLLLLGLLAALPVRAEPTAILAALQQTPADPAWWGEPRVVDVADFAALKAVSGVRDGLGLEDFTEHKLSEADELAVTSLLWRLYVSVGFREYLLVSAAQWRQQVGVDFLDLAWFSQPGTPPRMLLLLGGAALPRGEALSVLADAGLEPVERGGTTVWARGEDNAMDLKHREPGFPFWGWLGSSARIFRADAALVGARNWADLDLALAVERGEAESLADLPAYRLAVEAAGAPEVSQGAILQMSFADQDAGEGALGLAPRADGLPPFELFAFADREDATGHQVILVLAYGADAAAAAEAAELLPGAIAAARDRQGGSLAERFPGLSVSATSLQSGNGAAAVVRLATPPEPLRVDGKVNNRSRLYAHVLRLLYQRDLGFLATRG